MSSLNPTRKEDSLQAFLNRRARPGNLRASPADEEQLNLFRSPTHIYEVTIRDQAGRTAVATTRAKSPKEATRAVADFWKFMQQMT